MARKVKGVLIVNLGTPKSFNVGDVRAYLREFLMDERVIDIPFITRWPLVNLVIAPFRSPKSAKEYVKVWTDEGSPLMVHGLKVEKLLQQSLGNDYIVSLGMRYQTPSIAEALKAFEGKGIDELIVIPLFPQYASATTGSVAQKVMEEIKNLQVIPSVRFVEKFFEHPTFIDALTAIAKPKVESGKYEHFVFSYHGLPERQIHKAAVNGYCKLSECCNTYNSKNTYCYRAQCFATTRLFVEKLGLTEDQYSICFQSRLGRDPWIRPYIDDTIDELRAKGVTKVLAFSPSFIADCLETTIEIGHAYKEVFLEKGGEEWDLVDSLNDHPLWIQTLKEIVEAK